MKYLIQSKGPSQLNLFKKNIKNIFWNNFFFNYPFNNKDPVISTVVAWVSLYKHLYIHTYKKLCRSAKHLVLLWCRNCSKAFLVWTEALSVMQFATLLFDLKRSFTKRRFCCNFCSDKRVQTWFGPFQKPIQYGTFHFQQQNGAILFQSRNCFESGVPSVNRSPIQYTFCGISATLHFTIWYSVNIALQKV